MTVRLWDRNANQCVWAELLPQVTPQQLVETEKQWAEFRRQAEARRRRDGIPVPEHNHWSWDTKSHELRFTAYRCVGIHHEGAIQGLMMVSTLAAEGRSQAHKGKPVLYIKYIESAPWNLRDYVDGGARFGGLGIALLGAAIGISAEEEFRGRIALHSLPQSEQFYAKFMEDLGIDPAVEMLRYFEMSEKQAHEFLKGGDS